MATVPLSASVIHFMQGVPFNNDYKNTRWFVTKTEQTNYFLGKPRVHSMTDASFIRIEGRNLIAVNKNTDDLWGTNYIMFQNAKYNNKWFYAFVTKLEYKNLNNTHVHFEIDVLQTWRFEMNFKPSYVVREHRPLWNSDGTPVVNTIDEELSYGLDYDVVEVKRHLPFDPILFMVVVTKSVMHVGNDEKNIKPIVNGLPQPLSYYVHPFKLDGTSPRTFVGANGTPISSPTSFLESIYTQDSAVDNVVSVYVTDFFGGNLSYNEGTDTMTFNSTQYSKVDIADDNATNATTIYVNSLDYVSFTKVFPDKYSGFEKPSESKLLMYPYTLTILDDFKGNRTEIKNEYVKGKELKIGVKGSLGTTNKTSYSVRDYLMDGIEHQGVAELENSVINANPNDLPIINDFLSAYLQGNRNSIENQKNSIMWKGATGAVSGGIGGFASAGGVNPIGVASGVTGVATGVGNAIIEMQGIQAKIKDIDNMPPQLVKMGSNTAFDYGNGVNGLFIVKKQIKPEYRKILSDFFNMFGYKTNEVKVPNFRTRQNWNYVQTLNCNILGNIANEDLQILKSIFDGGITLWHTEDVGNYDLSNGVR